MAKSYHHGDLRAALIEAAAQAVAENGLRALNLRTLARHAGVSEAAPYHHFKGKEALVAAVADAGYAELLRRLHDLAPADDPFVQLRNVGRVYIEFALDRPGYFRAMFGAHIEAMPMEMRPLETGRATADILTASSRAVATAIGAPERALSFELTAWSMVHGVATLLLEAEIRPAQRGTDTATVIDDALTTLAEGFRHTAV